MLFKEGINLSFPYIRHQMTVKMHATALIMLYHVLCSIICLNSSYIHARKKILCSREVISHIAIAGTVQWICDKKLMFH